MLQPTLNAAFINARPDAGVEVYRMRSSPLWTRAIVIVTVAALLLLPAAGAVSAAKGGNGGSSSSSSDFNYLVFPHYTGVDPATVVPKQVPHCITNSTAVPTTPTLVCYSPDFMRTAYNFDPLYSAGITGAGQTIV